MNYNIMQNINYIEVEKFDIKYNGIQVIEDNDNIEIYNDPFRTIPLFITRDHEDEIIIFSCFEYFYDLNKVDMSIDEVGFWEIILFGSALWTRTLYKNVEQMPSASKIIINKKTNQYKIERYWDYNIQEDKSIKSIEEAAKGLYDRLNNIFATLDKNQKYVMGMSGGMDSRITLAFLSKYIPKENLQLFTFGFHEKLLEYKYASAAAAALGYNKPIFHRLSTSSYNKAMGYLPRNSGGQIGINHCHILDFLKTNSITDNMITTSYTEVIFSLLVDCDKNDTSSSIEKKINSLNNLSDEIIKYMIQDYQVLQNNYKLTSNFSSITEYLYQTERHVKFHEYLSFCINNVTETTNPFLDYDLLTYVMSIPLKYKCKKVLQDSILTSFFDIKVDNISSSRFEWGEAGSNKLDWIKFKFLNRANAVLRLLTKGYIQLFNKYQTEELERLLYRNYHNDLKIATAKFVELELMTKEQKNLWDRLPLRTEGVGERYCLISLSKLL